MPLSLTSFSTSEALGVPCYDVVPFARQAAIPGLGVVAHALVDGLCAGFASVRRDASAVELGNPLGEPLGLLLGPELGDPLGLELGDALGDSLGLSLGPTLGLTLGAALGVSLGA